MSAKEQHGLLTLWFIADTDEPIVARSLGIIGTGFTNLERCTIDNFLDTVITTEGFVWHIFDFGES